MNQQRILVTGAGGFIGYNLSNHLAEQGHAVVGLDQHYPHDVGPGREARFERVEGDCRDEALLDRVLDGVGLVYHLASAHLQVSMEESEYWDINVRALRQLLEAAQRHGVRRYVHFSSVAVYGDLGRTPANEEVVGEPQSIYGRTKLAGEKVVLDYGREAGLPVVVLRPAWVYGPGCPRTLKLYRMLRKRRFLMIGSGDNLRHPIYINDMIQACERAAESGNAPGEVFVIAGDSAVTGRELIEGFCQALDVPRPRLRLPMPVGQTMALTAESLFGLVGKEPPISRRTLEFFTTNNAFDITKARERLNYRPMYTLEQGLRESRSWLEHAS